MSSTGYFPIYIFKIIFVCFIWNNSTGCSLFLVSWKQGNNHSQIVFSVWHLSSQRLSSSQSLFPSWKKPNLYDWKLWLWSLPSSYSTDIYSLQWLVCHHLVCLLHKNALNEFLQFFSRIPNTGFTFYSPKCIQRPIYNKFKTFSLNCNS